MPIIHRFLSGACLLVAACSSEPSAEREEPGAAGTGSSANVAGAAAQAGGGQTSQAGQSSSGGTAVGSTAGSGGSAASGAGGAMAGAANAGSSGAAGGSSMHAGDGCVPGGTGFDTGAEGVVVDRKTCLVWQREDPPRDMSTCELKRADVPSALCWKAAQAYCEALALDGQTDWRLPTVAELQTLIASPPPTPPVVPTIDHDAFPQAIANLYWSSESSGGKVHCADFNGGPPTSNTGPDGPQAFRCVRGGGAP